MLLYSSDRLVEAVQSMLTDCRLKSLEVFGMFVNCCYDQLVQWLLSSQI